MRWLGAVVIASLAYPAQADDFTEAGFRFELGLELLDEASKHLAAGRTSAAETEVKRALGEFLLSQRLSPNVSTQLNVGWCLERLGRWSEAFGVYTEAQAYAARPQDQNDLTTALTRVRTHVAALDITTSPTGAALWIDREDLGQRGESPRLLAVEPGVRRLIARAPGYRTYTTTVATELRTTTAVHLTLAPETGVVRVSSVPSGARVSVTTSSAALGFTPVTLALPVGPQRLTLSLTGHSEVRESLVVDSGAEVRVDVRLTPLPPPSGKLRVLANVDSALVEVDGAEAGFTPLVADLPEGPHRLVVRRPGFESFETELDVVAGGRSAFDVTLSPERGASAARDTWVRVLLGGAATAAAVGVVFGIRTQVLADEYQAEPSQSRLDDGTTSALVTDLSWLVAGGLGAVGALIWALEDAPEPSRGVRVDGGPGAAR